MFWTLTKCFLCLILLFFISSVTVFLGVPLFFNIDRLWLWLLSLYLLCIGIFVNIFPYTPMSSAHLCLLSQMPCLLFLFSCLSIKAITTKTILIEMLRVDMLMYFLIVKIKNIKHYGFFIGAFYSSETITIVC